MFVGYFQIVAHGSSLPLLDGRSDMAKEERNKPSKAKSKENKVKEVAEQDAVPYEVRMKAVTVISKPMASEKKVR